MNTKKHLKELFGSQKNELAKKLSNLSLPNDGVQVQTLVMNYLNELFDSDGEFRQNLTQSEDYVLQAAISLLNANQSIVLEIVSNIQHTSKEKNSNSNHPVPEQQNNNGIQRKQYPAALGGTTIGGTVGALTFGTWGSVIGAIAGTALVLYCATSISKPIQKPILTKDINAMQMNDNKINVSIFLDIVEQICESIDILIDTFRIQVERVKDSFNTKNERSFLSEYKVIADRMEDLFLMADSDEEQDIEAVIQQIALLRRSLSNYGLEFKDGKILRK